MKDLFYLMPVFCLIGYCLFVLFKLRDNEDVSTVFFFGKDIDINNVAVYLYAVPFMIAIFSPAVILVFTLLFVILNKIYYVLCLYLIYTFLVFCIKSVKKSYVLGAFLLLVSFIYLSYDYRNYIKIDLEIKFGEHTFSELYFNNGAAKTKNTYKSIESYKERDNKYDEHDEHDEHDEYDEYEDDY